MTRKKRNELNDPNDDEKRFNLNENEFKDNTMKKHINNVVYYSFVPLCIHALVCILTPVYYSCCPGEFAETCNQATLSKSIWKKISTRAPFVII